MKEPPPTLEEMQLFVRANELSEALRKVINGDGDELERIPEDARMVVQFTALTNVLAAMLLIHDVTLEYFLGALMPVLDRMRRDVAARIVTTGEA